MSADRRRVASVQTFLRSLCLVDRLLARSAVGPDDLVVEIGPGMGVITETLAGRFRQVLAIEKDLVLARRLRDLPGDVPNVALIEADTLAFPLPLTPSKVFASIPFNAPVAIGGRLTAEPWAPIDAHLVVQREAAFRFLGKPPETLVSLLLKAWIEPTLVHRFRRDDFAPPPGVEVVMLGLRQRGQPLVAPAEARTYRHLVVVAVTARRATLPEAPLPVIGRDGAPDRTSFGHHPWPQAVGGTVPRMAGPLRRVPGRGRRSCPPRDRWCRGAAPGRTGGSSADPPDPNPGPRRRPRERGMTALPPKATPVPYPWQHGRSGGRCGGGDGRGRGDGAGARDRLPHRNDGS